mgnify:CR=1 FL=1
MKRKNLIARKKVKNNKHLFKDSKILNFYKKFKSIIFKDIKDKSFALAVSGGSDSLCLAYFSKIYSSEFDNKIHILIVDHNLRKESYKEALIVKEILRLAKSYRKKLNSNSVHWNFSKSIEFYRERKFIEQKFLATLRNVSRGKKSISSLIDYLQLMKDFNEPTGLLKKNEIIDFDKFFDLKFGITIDINGLFLKPFLNKPLSLNPPT